MAEKNRPLARAWMSVLFFALICCCAAGAGENLLRNGDFESEDLSEILIVAYDGTCEFSIHTEEETQNKCAKLELTGYGTSEEGKKKINISLLIGGASGRDGHIGTNAVRVKPNTTYEVSLQMRGTLNYTHRLTAYVWPQSGEGYYSGRVQIPTSIAGTIKIQPYWVQYKVTFTTGPDAYTASLRIPIWCEENDFGEISEALGNYLLVDNVSIIEKDLSDGNGGAAFRVALANPTVNFSAPLPYSSLDVPEEINVYAATNEYESVPVVITNLTELPEFYRIIVFGKQASGIEQRDLPGAENNVFPGDAVVMRQAVKVKESDSPDGFGLRYDPLVAMNNGYTIMVPPGDSGVVWITFDCRDVNPDSYSGFLRVIPLNQPGKYIQTGNTYVYEGPMVDIPLNLTVWPIELSKDPPLPLCLFHQAENQQFFEDMFAHSVRYYQVNSWAATIRFNNDGSIIEPIEMPTFHKYVEQINWFPAESEAYLWLGYSFYKIFEEEHSKGRFEFGSQQWETAWSSFLQAVDAGLKEYGLTNRDYLVEMFDEPDVETELEKILLVCKVAKEAVPQMRIQLTIGWPSRLPEIYEPLIPYVDNWNFNEVHYSREENLSFFQSLRQMGKEVWFYACEMNMREDLYRYYRLHAWKGYAQNLDGLGMWEYIGGPGGMYGADSWKIAAEGPLVYRSFDKPIPSIRYECLREGFDDIRYLAKLKYLHCYARKVCPTHSLTTAVGAFLEQVGRDVLFNYAHDRTFADQKRHQAAQYIIELQDLLKDKYF